MAASARTEARRQEQERELGARSSKGFTVPQRAQHMPSWGLELIRAGAGWPVCAASVCVFNEDTSRGGGGGGEKLLGWRRRCSRYEIRETDTKDMDVDVHGHVCEHAQLQTPLIAPANGRAVPGGGAHAQSQS